MSWRGWGGFELVECSFCEALPVGTVAWWKDVDHGVAV